MNKYPLTYSFLSNLQFPHRLTCPIMVDLCEYQAFDDMIPGYMKSYGEFYEDFVLGYGEKLFCAYFKDKTTAMRFKLEWCF